MIAIYLIGTAGSGKSRLTYAFHSWCETRGLSAITVNLDPGVDKLPYTPDVDVREWIHIKEIMEEYGLGPNGAQVVCADLLALNITEVKERISEFRADYVVMDTPGQLELFVFRRAGKIMVDQVIPQESLVAFLVDPALVSTPSGFVSQLLLSSLTHFQFRVPLANVLSKMDLVDKDSVARMTEWGENPPVLYEDVIRETPSLHRQISEGILTLLQDMGGYIPVTPVSSETLEGLDDLYAVIQNVFMGGEDLLDD